MSYQNAEVARVAELLIARLANISKKQSILRSVELRGLYDQIKALPADQRASFGAEVNNLKNDLINRIEDDTAQEQTPNQAIDLSAPYNLNTAPHDRPKLLPAQNGTIHPLSSELNKVLDIFYRMGFCAEESRQLDDDWHMFTSLNFPANHPARDDYDTFITDEGLIAPAHTSTMQNRVLVKYKDQLKAGKGIRVVIPGRVFRNEDLDARHEHTFHQLEGVVVDSGIHAGHLISTLKSFIEEYYQQKVEIKTQPYYFPFTEPSFEFLLSCPFCKKVGCSICSHSGWIELIGCGMIHPRVLEMAGIDPTIYSGFAWGGGIERLVMMKYGIEDVRHFHSANLKFLRQF